MVTAEFSFAVLGVAILLVFFGWFAALGITWLKCENAAYLVAKDYSRNDLLGVTKTKENLSKEFGVEIIELAEEITVRVSTKAKPLGALLPAISIQAQVHTKR